MKKVLILAYDFPPYVSVGGLRPYSWYKYLFEFDIYPIVVTRQWSNKYGNHLDYISPSETNQIIIEQLSKGMLIKTPYFPNLSNKLKIKYCDSKYKFLCKLISAFYEFAQFLFLIGPKVQIYFAANDYLKANKVDIIIATGDPFVLFQYASKLSKKYNTPWIADYRDPWSQGMAIQKNIFLKTWCAYLEKTIVKKSILITTVSDFFKTKHESVIENKRLCIIPNGYDPKSFPKLHQIKQQNEIFSIAFVGTIYKWHPLESFLDICNNFLKSTNNLQFQINFYGVNLENEIRKLIQSKYPEIIQNVNIYIKMPNEQLLQKLAIDNVLLLFNDYSIVGTKIYDYLGINRKILLCYSDDKEAIELKRKYYNTEEFENESHHIQEDLINETNSGIIVKDSSHLSQVLFELYSEFKANGFIKCNSINTEQFSRKIQVQKLAEIIKILLKD